MTKRTVIIGVGGPVGSGKTLLLERLTRRMSDLNLAVITNDIYTKEDALFLAKNSSLDEDRIIGVETGGCPHTAIREDASMNFEAIETLQERFNHDLDVISLKVVETTWLRPSALIWLILPFILLTLLRVKKSHVRLVKG